MRRRYVRGALVVLGAAALMATVAAQDVPPPLVSSQELLDGLKADGSRWLTFGGNYTNQRHSPLTQITPANVTRLVPQWVFQTDTPGRFETTPLVRDNVLYVTGPLNVAWAIDARTGREIWRYKRELPPTGGLTACCGLVNRGFGVLGDRLFMTTLDAHLLALDMKTGAVVWDATLEDFSKGYASTIAPLVVKDKVIVGVAGGEYGIRGFMDAYDAKTGKRAWRFYTIPGPGEPGHDTWAGDSRRRERVGDRRVRSGPQPGVLRHRKSRSRLSQREPQGRQPVQRCAGRARSGYRHASMALPVHAARSARLGRDGSAGARRSHHRRPAAQGSDAREPQRLLLHARSHQRHADRREALRGDDVGEGDWRRWTADDSARLRARREGLADVSRRHGRDELLAPVVRPLATPVLRQRTRGVRHLLRVEAGVRAGRALHRRRRAARDRPRHARVRSAARHRSRDRRAPVGVPVHQPLDGRRADDGVGPGVQRRCRGQFPRVRFTCGQAALALPDGIRAARHVSHHLHARWPPAAARSSGRHAHGVGARRRAARPEHALRSPVARYHA